MRGIGSLYYLSYATVNAEFSGIDPVWAIVSLTIVISIILHGVTATPVMYLLDLARLGRRHPRHRIV